jgi:dolichol-phosphate mannosyltransferase
MNTSRETPKSLSIVIPCFNEEEVLDTLVSRIREVVTPINVPFELVLIDDGSRDRTWELISAHRAKHPFIKGIRLSRNFGHQLALTCGLDQAKGEVIIIMDADLQDPPELLPQMLEKWREGYDVVFGKRSARHGESAAKRFFAYMFYRIIRQIIKLDIPEDTGDFRLMDRKALRALQGLRERHRFIRGMVSWIGFKQTPLYYERPQRFAGTTKYPFKKSLLLAFDAITSFSYAPLRLASYLGIATSALALVYIFVVIVLKLLGINFPGYTSLMASILLLGGVQLIVLGLIGEYVGRIFEQGQMRPLYLIDSIVGEPLPSLKPSDSV